MAFQISCRIIFTFLFCLQWSSFYVSSLNDVTYQEFVNSGALRICNSYQMSVRYDHKKICESVDQEADTAYCPSMHVQFKDGKHEVKYILVCTAGGTIIAGGKIKGCAYAASKDPNDYSYNTLAYDDQNKCCY